MIEIAAVLFEIRSSYAGYAWRSSMNAPVSQNDKSKNAPDLLAAEPAVAIRLQSDGLERPRETCRQAVSSRFPMSSGSSTTAGSQRAPSCQRAP